MTWRLLSKLSTILARARIDIYNVSIEAYTAERALSTYSWKIEALGLIARNVPTVGGSTPCMPDFDRLYLKMDAFEETVRYF